MDPDLISQVLANFISNAIKFTRAGGRIRLSARRAADASSAVECVNSVVRMHQARHRNLSQELLDLKRLYFNCRAFLEGKRKKHCPYELLGLKLPSYDPWVSLQMDPAELDKLLSSSELTV